MHDSPLIVGNNCVCDCRKNNELAAFFGPQNFEGTRSVRRGDDAIADLSLDDRGKAFIDLKRKLPGAKLTLKLDTGASPRQRAALLKLN